MRESSITITTSLSRILMAKLCNTLAELPPIELVRTSRQKSEQEATPLSYTYLPQLRALLICYREKYVKEKAKAVFVLSLERQA